MKKSVSRFAFIVVAIVTLFAACTTGPGPGGKASIQGKVKMTNRWSATCTELAQPFDSFYAGDVDVYIIYGDDPSYGDRVKTGPDGTFWFKYLRPGKYTVYAFSKDCNATDGSETKVVELSCEITDKGQTLITEDLQLEK
jgi:hypothetical protein